MSAFAVSTGSDFGLSAGVTFAEWRPVILPEKNANASSANPATPAREIQRALRDFGGLVAGTAVLVDRDASPEYAATLPLLLSRTRRFKSAVISAAC